MYLGLDIGTTSICAVVLDGSGNIVYTATKANTFAYQQDSAKLQNPQGIFSLCEEILDEVAKSSPSPA